MAQRPNSRAFSILPARARVVDEEDRSEIGARCDEERPEGQRQEPDPARRRVTVAPGGDLARDDRPDRASHEERGDDRGEREDDGRAAAPRGSMDLAEREVRRRAGRSRARPGRAGCRGSLITAENASGNPVQRTTRMKMSQTWLASQTGAASARSGGGPTRGPMLRLAYQLPGAGAEVGSGEDGVEGGAEEQHRGDHLGLAHFASPSSGGSPGGPYGIPASSSSPDSRQRRDIERSTQTVAAPSAA